MHMGYRVLFIGIFCALSTYSFSQIRDGIELQSSKNSFQIKPYGKEVTFSKSEVITVELKPNFHNHDGKFYLDTMLVFIAPWAKSFHALETGIHTLEVKATKLDKIEKILIHMGDPVSPSMHNDTFAVNFQLTYVGKAKIKKPIKFSFHLGGSEAQAMGWNYLSHQYTLNAEVEKCITEEPPKEVNDFLDGFVQEINFYGSIPYYFSTSYNNSYRKMCVKASPKKAQTTQWELRHIVLRGL